MDASEIAVLVDEFEDRVERLRALYEQYFMGIERLEPLILRKDVDRRLWQLRREQIRNTALRFKLQTTVQRYNTYQQYWQRICREIENGTYYRDVSRAAARFGDVALTAMGRKRQRMFEKGLERRQERDEVRKSKEPGGPAPTQPSDRPAVESPPAELSISDRPPPGSPPSEGNEPLLELEDLADLAPLAEELIATIDRPPQIRTTPSQASFASPTSMGRPPRTPFLVPSDPPPTRQPPLVAAPPPPVIGQTPDLVPPIPPQPLPTLMPRPQPQPQPQPQPDRVPQPARRRSVPATAPSVHRGLVALSIPTSRPPPPARPPSAPAEPTPAGPATPEQGRPEPAPPRIEAPRTPKRVQGAAHPVAAQPTAAGGDDLPDGRVRQIYGAYVEAKRRCHESTAGITFDRLSANLRRTASELQGKHPGRQIDFEVIIKNGAAVLRPVVRR